MNQPAKTAIKGNKPVPMDRLTFKYNDGCLFIKLPSGRWMSYYRTQIEDDGQITYDGTDSTKAWIRQRTWGGKLTENIVQAIARDILCESLRKIDLESGADGFQIVMHVHDEIIAEIPEEWETTEPITGISLQRMCDLMTENNGWDDGIYHPAPGYLTKYYMKD